jgi:hypothetical protein
MIETSSSPPKKDSKKSEFVTSLSGSRLRVENLKEEKGWAIITNTTIGPPDWRPTFSASRSGFLFLPIFSAWNLPSPAFFSIIEKF